MMNAEIISIGDELLIGQVINTNSSWIAQQLNRTGIKVYQITTISDSREQILNSIQEAQSRSDIILITGGLGPTNDDITKQVLCEYFKTSLIFNEQAYKDIKKLFKQRGFKVTKLNKKQAELPENCLPIRNTNGTASGMWFEKNGKIFVSMPGVPFEMKPMITDFILP
ncbi:MAG: competence/damage-inducible protein A, partial [Bacteroidales bacterium]|nr:competence/damage-inducible protein A [Bacteroidales bacterium]